MKRSRAALSVVFAIIPFAALGADYPVPKQGDFIAKDFKFHTGEVMAEVKLHYTTVGEPTGQAVLVLHGTGGSAASMLTPSFAGQLFGAGEPLDASKYYIIIPDALGHGKSSKPSDGLKTAFPKYNYDDMVDAQYRLVREGLGIKHLRLVIGNSMGGMQSWIWAGKYPDLMDAVVPMASQPTAMSARNWMLRRMMIETIRNDPDYNNGNYTAQPRMMKYALAAYGFASSGGTLAYQNEAATAEKADKMVEERLASPIATDTNDFIYQWQSSHDYDASKALERIEASLLAINSADDERNPPETGVTQAAMKREERPALSHPCEHRDARSRHDGQRFVLQAGAAAIAAERAATDDVMRRYRIAPTLASSALRSCCAFSAADCALAADC
jgi:homoserine O-acetyltransferase